MKIDKIESFFIGNGYVVRIHTDTGISGVGQTACWGYPEAVHSIVNTFEKYLIGQNPMRIEHHWQYLYRMGPFRGTALSGAISAVDIALWDIKGKHFGVPIWELLGGNCRDKSDCISSVAEAHQRRCMKQRGQPLKRVSLRSNLILWLEVSKT